MRMRALWAAGAAGALLLVPVAAHADDPLISTPDGVPRLERLAPGSLRTTPLVLGNPTDGPAELRLGIRVTDEDENGCVRPETRVGTEDCDADGGELGDSLTAAVEHDGDVLWAGPIHDLADPRRLPGTLPAGASWDLDLTLGLPAEAGNDTMTDRISFDLVVHATEVAGETATDPADPDDTEVLGVEASADGGEDGDGAGVSEGATSVPAAVDAGLHLFRLDDLTDAGRARLTLLALGGALVAAGGWTAMSRSRRRTARAAAPALTWSGEPAGAAALPPARARHRRPRARGPRR